MTIFPILLNELLDVEERPSKSKSSLFWCMKAFLKLYANSLWQVYTTSWSQNIPEVISCWYSSTFQNCQHYTYLENKWRRGCLKESKKHYFNWNRRTLYKFHKVQEPTNKTIIFLKLLIKMRHSISHKVKFIVYKLYQNCKGQSTLSKYHF